MVSLNDLQTPSKVSKLKVADLKEELEKYGLSQDGLKSELVERLKQHLQSSDSEKPDGEPNTEEIEMQDKDEKEHKEVEENEEADQDNEHEYGIAEEDADEPGVTDDAGMEKVEEVEHQTGAEEPKHISDDFSGQCSKEQDEEQVDEQAGEGSEEPVDEQAGESSVSPSLSADFSKVEQKDEAEDESSRLWKRSPNDDSPGDKEAEAEEESRSWKRSSNDDLTVDEEAEAESRSWKRSRDDSEDKFEPEPAKLVKTEAAGDKSTGTPVVKGEIFVGGLAKDVTEEDLRQLFETVGEVEEVRLQTDKATGSSKGYGFVRFPNKSIRDEAIKKYDRYSLKGKEIGVTSSMNNNTLYIGLLTRTWTEEELSTWLKEKCEGFVRFDLMLDPNNKTLNRGFGFLVFDHHQSAMGVKKISQDKGLEIQGVKLSVDWADPREDPDEQTMSQVKSLYVSQLDYNVTEEMIKEAFGVYGEVDKVALSNKMQYAKRKDFAFVTFKEREPALKALDELNGKPLKDFPSKPMDITLARPQTKKKGEFVGRGGGRSAGRVPFGRGGGGPPRSAGRFNDRGRGRFQSSYGRGGGYTSYGTTPYQGTPYQSGGGYAVQPVVPYQWAGGYQQQYYGQYNAPQYNSTQYPPSYGYQQY